MPKIIIFGNSGSGKTTLAKKLAQKYQCAHLDLDTLAWLDTQAPTRQPIDVSQKQLQQFTEKSHVALFDQYSSKKTEHQSNDRS